MDPAIRESQPVLAGVAQQSVRSPELREAPEPLAMLEAAARRAAEDAGAGRELLEAIDCIGLTLCFGWHPSNGPRLLGERLGARPRLELVTPLGGESALTLVNHAAREIAAGRSRVALLAGSNNLASMLEARRQGIRLPWTLGGTGEPASLGEARPGHCEREARYGLTMPTEFYPIFENALRARRGLDLETHRQRMGELFHRFTRVAARNPHAWFPTERSAEELVTVTAQNRMIAFPYPKYLNAVMETDQSAALLMLSPDAARELGIPEDRQVRWWGGGGAIEEPWFMSDRPDLAVSPALRASARQALAEGGVELEAVGAFDFYSCFPVAVEMACEMLGLDEEDPRGFTVTGGLPYAGGPGNNYCMHAVAAMVEQLRERPEAPGLVTGNGWYLTRHSATLLGVGPPPARRPARAAPPTPPVKAVEVVEEASGRGRVESYTVLYDREGAPVRGIVLGRQEDGRRFLANTAAERSLLEDFVAQEGVGRRGRLLHVDGLNRFDPA